MKKTVSFLVLFLVMSTTVTAQDAEFERWKRGYEQEYQNYQDSVNAAFRAFLDKAWVQMQVKAPVRTYVKPKPVEIPIFEPSPTITPSATPEAPKEQPSPRPEPVPAPQPTIKPSLPASAFLFGKPIQLPPIPFAPSNERTSVEAVKDFWEKASSRADQATLNRLKSGMNELQLSDWARFQYVQAWVKTNGRQSSADQQLSTWFWMQQLGYDIRLGISSNQYLLLMAFDQPLYEVTYYTLDGRKYYVADPEARIPNSRISTYDGIAGKELAWKEKTYPLLGQKNKVRSFRFSYKGKNYVYELPVNEYRIQYLQQLPRSKPELYYSLQPNIELVQALDRQIEATLKTMSEHEKAGFLLRMVQKSFPYQTDDEQFGEEKYMSPEETFWYPYSDCEDRTALYAWLLSHYTNLDFAFVRYEGHIALAIKTNAFSEADAYRKSGNRYVVADPTYIGAPIGLEMPKHKGQGKLIIPS